MILHKDCFQFLLGLTMVPRENKNNTYGKFGWTNKEYYNGIFRIGLFLCIFWQPMNNSATDFFKSGQHSVRNSHVNQRICEWVMCINTLKVKNSKWWLLKGQRKDLLRKKYMFYTIYAVRFIGLTKPANKSYLVNRPLFIWVKRNSVQKCFLSKETTL